MDLESEIKRLLLLLLLLLLLFINWYKTRRRLFPSTDGSLVCTLKRLKIFVKIDYLKAKRGQKGVQRGLKRSNFEMA